MSAPLLTTTGLVAGYTPEVDILCGVDLVVEDGEIVTVVGPNGAGKSTLIKTIVGLVAPREGTIAFAGDEIGGLAPHRINRIGLTYVPQLENVFPSLSVEENLEVGALALEPSQRRARIAEAYDRFPRLGERRRQRAGTMSGGERQMVAIARALIPGPSLLVLDEPSAGLAPQAVDEVFETIASINASGTTILMVEQNARRALCMSTRGYVLELGRNRFEGPGQALVDDPKVAELYLGGSAIA